MHSYNGYLCMRKRIIVVGAGAAGLMAACAASDAGADVTVYEQNEKAGKKIYITGKGRCNFTNACETEEFFQSVVRNPKFLYSAVYGYDAREMIRFLEENGCKTKVERGNRAFPVSDHASDVTKALTTRLRRNGVRIVYNMGVQRLLISQNSPHPEDTVDDRKVTGILLRSGKAERADAVIVATGGLSYPSTGSTGDGLKWARDLGLLVTECAPSLVPLETAEDWTRELQGLALKNVSVKVLPIVGDETMPSMGETSKECAATSNANSIMTDTVNAINDDKMTDSVNDGTDRRKQPGKKRKIKPVYEGFGEMLFTHFGMSGPLILSASCHLDWSKHTAGYLLHLDLKPALTIDQLEARIKRELAATDKALTNVLRALLPGDLPRVIAREAGMDGSRPAHTINEREMHSLAAAMKDLRITITGTRGYAEAIVTRGGISVKEINPSTMEARKVRGLYFAGEMMDVDAYTGGFNLQIAWSTGHLAGVSAAEIE